MPVLVDEDMFERVQNRFAQNQRLGRHAKDENALDAPRYWLTGKLCCGECRRTAERVEHERHGAEVLLLRRAARGSSATCAARARTTSRVWCCSHCTTSSTTRRSM